eukprot:15220777-Alexandrium_andersonii.AAC.1
MTSFEVAHGAAQLKPRPSLASSHCPRSELSTAMGVPCSGMFESGIQDTKVHNMGEQCSSNFGGFSELR